RLDPVRRWRRVWFRRRDRYRHRPVSCPRAGRGRAIVQLQIPRPWDGPDAQLNRLPVTLPPHAPGLKVGLLGGSFNPPHAGHRAISLFAMRRLGLDRVWWLVTPGNPLKSNRRLPPLAARMAAARRIARHPRIDVTGFEQEIGTRYTIDMLVW